MREREPLESWLIYSSIDAEQPRSPSSGNDGNAALNKLAEALAEAPPGKLDFHRIRGIYFSRFTSPDVQDHDAPEVRRLFIEVWQRGGPGSAFVLEGLIEGLAMAATPAAVPFWQELLDLSRPRDRGVTERRTYALAALALLAIARDDQPAYAALLQALGHAEEHVRAMAAFYLARAYGVPGRPLPEQVEAALADHGASDRAFTPRFQARMALRYLGLPLPHDNADAVYFLQVRLRHDRATRTLAILPDATLTDLHYAIQEAFGWDADHLYSFFMNGDRDAPHYEISCPELADDWESGTWTMTRNGEPVTLAEIVATTTADDDSTEEDEDDTPYASNTLLSSLGLVPKHKFSYFFDFGDSHLFDVTVLGVEPRFDDGEYPRVIEAVGNAPIQYARYEDDDEDGEEA